MLKRIGSVLVVLAVVSTFGLTGCSSGTDNGDTAPTVTPGLTDQEKESVTYIYELEKLARDVYKYLYEKWGNPVLNVISGSEQSHMDIMKEIMDKYILADPVAGKGNGEFSKDDLRQMYLGLIEQGSVSEVSALSTAAELEELDILDIAEASAVTDKFELVSAFNKLTEGSQNHLGIFVARLKDKDVEYLPLHLSQAVFGQIIASVTTPSTTGTPSTATFAELAVKGKASYSGNCFNCHGNSLSTGITSTAILSFYQNAQNLLNKISTMPNKGPQDQWEVLSYLLLEHHWVSGDEVFDKDTLAQILFTP